jgi:hypothetical protein
VGDADEADLLIINGQDTARLLAAYGKLPPLRPALAAP